jgi:hypothetical protein
LAKGVSVMAVIYDPQCREAAINWSNPRTLRVSSAQSGEIDE